MNGSVWPLLPEEVFSVLKTSSQGLSTEGRKPFGNITKYLNNATSANYGNMLTAAISSLSSNSSVFYS